MMRVHYTSEELRIAERHPIAALGKHLFESAWSVYKGDGYKGTEKSRALYDLSCELFYIHLVEDLYCVVFQ